LCVPFLKLGGHLLAYKSENVEDELKDAKNVFDILGVRLDNITETILPNSLKKRKILIIRKVKSTDLKYPRKNGIPQKRPLK
jgi:16S rRNA (guanine527-N7)-methyltransferase